MDEAVRKVKETILFSYRCTWKLRLLLYSAITIIGLLTIYPFWRLAHPGNYPAILRYGAFANFSILFFLVWFVFRRLAHKIACTALGIEVVTFTLGRELIEWSRVRAFLGVSRKLAILMPKGKMYLYLPLPRHLLDKIAQILCESSDAQVAGFDLTG